MPLNEQFLFDQFEAELFRFIVWQRVKSLPENEGNELAEWVEEADVIEIEDYLDKSPPTTEEKDAAFLSLKQGLSQLDDHCGAMSVNRVGLALTHACMQMLLRLKRKYLITQDCQF